MGKIFPDFACIVATNRAKDDKISIHTQKNESKPDLAS